MLTWTNAYSAGVCSVETARNPAGPWTWVTNAFTLQTAGQVTLAPAAGNTFYRLLASDLSGANPSGFAHLTESYGLIHAIAGTGGGCVDGINYWQPWFEGGFATNATLSRPHFAMADNSDNIFIVDKNSHSVLKRTADGRIHTVAGTHSAGNGADTPAAGTSIALNAPNGLWVGSDGSVYILDTGNGKVRWLTASGIISTLLVDTNGITGGRGLWVRDDRALCYYVNGNDVKRWAPGAKIKSVNSSHFIDPGNLVVIPDGNLVVTDRGDARVYLLLTSGASAGTRTVLFGNGTTNAVVDGALATATGLYGVRGVWPFPTGGYLLSTHEGSQVLYVDPAGIIHILVDGAIGAHYGDGSWFYTPSLKVSEVRSVAMDSHGNILLVENDCGYVRQIDFRRLVP